MIRTVSSSSGSSRLAEAHRFLAAHRGGDALIVIADARDAADDFVIDWTKDARATFGIARSSSMQTIARAARLGMAMAGFAPATPLASAAVAARVAQEAAREGRIEKLAAVRDHPGFARALSATLAELRLAEVTSQALRSGEDPRSAELATLLEAYDRALEEAALADRAKMVALAIDGLATSGLLGTRLLLLDLSVRSSLEGRFWRGVLSAAREALVLLPDGDPATAKHLELSPIPPSASGPASLLHPLLDGLFSRDEKRSPQAIESRERLEVFSAPGEGRECVELARRILRQADAGIPFDKMAVLLRTPEAYAPLLETAFRRSRIPAFFARGTRRPDPAGRAFLALLGCGAESLSAKRFAEYLSFAEVPERTVDGAPPSPAPVWTPPEEESLAPAAQLSLFAPSSPSPSPSASAPAPALAPSAAPSSARSQSTTSTDANNEPVPESRAAGSLPAPWKWESYLVEAAVIGGRARWERRLSGFARELEIQKERLTQEDPESPRLPALTRDRENVDHLRRFALPIIDDLDGFPREALWGEWLTRLRELAPRVLRNPDRVLALLAELEPMASVGPVTLAEVRAVLSPRLSTLESDPPPSRYGRVFVGTPDHARGRSFDTVFVPALAERLFPQRPREDPFLLDAARRIVSSNLRTQKERGQDERLKLRLALGVATERIVLSYPRLEVVEARPRVPSFYCLEVTRAATGEIPDLDLLERAAARTGGARLAWPAPTDANAAIDPVEHDLSVLGALLDDPTPARSAGQARYLLELNPYLARSLRQRWQRWRMRSWTAADGIVHVTEAIQPILERNRLFARPYSVTALENFSACPYRFLLASIHRLEPRAEAASPVRMDPLTRGQIVHEIHARVLAAFATKGTLPLTPDRLSGAEQTLRNVVEEIAARYREELAPAIPRIWEDEIAALFADLRIWLRRMTAAGGEWNPEHFELAFGLPRQAKSWRDPASLPDPVSLEGNWLLRGAIDLVERRVNAPDELRVTDLKTGKNYTQTGTITQGGSILQPVLYALAVEAMSLGSSAAKTGGDDGSTGAEGTTNACGRAMKTNAPTTVAPRVVESRLSFATSRGGFTECVVPLGPFARLYAQQLLSWIDSAVAAGRLPAAPDRDACGFCDFRPVCGPAEERRTQHKPLELLTELNSVRELP